ncbi:MAG: hypothetical protein JXR94_19840 [Candidatus Hydrogenedentes bacterium]|nr:hypothetical protein [Candidatus Hydrogenedentota bacterium]
MGIGAVLLRVAAAAALAVAVMCLPGRAARAAADPVEKAPPKAGRTVGPPLSDTLPEAFTQLPRFGAIEWTTRRLPWVAPGPDAGVSGMGMVAHEGMLYVCGGFIPAGDGSGDEASHRTSRWAWRYSPADDRWDRLPDAPIRREYVRAIAAQDAVYLVGGACQYKGQPPGYRAHGDCVRLDLTARPPSWHAHSTLKVPRTHMAVGHAAGRLVVAGGNEYDIAQKGYGPGTIRATTETLDLAQPGAGWREAAPMPGPRGWAASVATDSALYVFGGLTWTEPDTPRGVRQTLRYDPAADRWETRTPPPLAVSAWEGALYAGRYAILVGGVERREGAAPASLVWCDLAWAYDLEGDRWLQIEGALPPGAVFNDPGVAVIGDTIYVAGAEGPYGSHYNYFLAGRIKKNR